MSSNRVSASVVQRLYWMGAKIVYSHSRPNAWCGKVTRMNNMTVSAAPGILGACRSPASLPLQSMGLGRVTELLVISIHMCCYVESEIMSHFHIILRQRCDLS